MSFLSSTPTQLLPGLLSLTEPDKGTAHTLELLHALCSALKLLPWGGLQGCGWCGGSKMEEVPIFADWSQSRKLAACGPSARTPPAARRLPASSRCSAGREESRSRSPPQTSRLGLPKHANCCSPAPQAASSDTTSAAPCSPRAERGSSGEKFETQAPLGPCGSRREGTSRPVRRNWGLRSAAAQHAAGPAA